MKMLFAAVLMACVSVGRFNPSQLLRPSVIQCPIQDFVHLDDHIQPTYETVTPEFKPFTISVLLQTGQLQKLQHAGPNCKDFTEVARSS